MGVGGCAGLEGGGKGQQGMFTFVLCLCCFLQLI